jgi:bacteriocin biosynthesis cyclodehydratase domain-containing protein
MCIFFGDRMRNKKNGSKKIERDVTIYSVAPNEVIIKKGFIFPEYYRLFDKRRNIVKFIKEILKGKKPRKPEDRSILIELKENRIITEKNLKFNKASRLTILIFGENSQMNRVIYKKLSLMRNLNIKIVKSFMQLIKKLQEKRNTFILIYTTDHYSEEEIEKINQIILKEKIPTLLIAYEKKFGVVGPLVIPGETACFKCFTSRINSCFDEEFLKTFQLLNNYPQLKFEKYQHKQLDIEDIINIELVSSLTLYEIYNFLTNEIGFTISQSLFIDFKHMEFEIGYIVKNPLCSMCSQEKPIKNLYLPISTILKWGKEV